MMLYFSTILYINLRSAYFPNRKEDSEGSRLFYQRLKYFVLLIFFIVSLSFLYIINPNDVVTKYFGSVILFSILLGTFIVTMISWYNYAYKHESFVNHNYKDKEPAFTYLSKAIMVLFSFVVSGLLIGYIFSLIDPLSNTTSILSTILNILIIITILSLTYKILNSGKNKSPFLSLILNLLFYIPCLFSLGIDYAVKFIIRDYNSTTGGSIILLVLMMILLTIYFKMPNLEEKINLT
jgi:hypothetical protein